jgi:DNA polymerase-3 subunit alpha
MLHWEKDLTGTYISAHPLQQVTVSLGDMVTAYSGEMTEELVGQRHTVAGMVTRVHQIMTRKGNQMAFAQLEDLQGTIDVVIFPRTWERTKELWQTDRILIVTGKVDDSRQDISLICDAVQTDVAQPQQPEPDLPMAEAWELEEPDWPAPPPDMGPDFGLSPDNSHRQDGPYRIEITFHRSANREADLERLGRVYRLLGRYPGQDHFILQVEANGQAWELSFPNDTTRYCAELEQELVEMLGEGVVRVEVAAGTAR